MKRLTTDDPSSNFETMLNFVYGKDGWAVIRDVGEDVEVPLTQWAKAECLRHGCDEFSAETPEDIDMEVGDCIMDFPDCPIALAYTFASQAVHLRSRLKMYEDILFDGEGRELVTVEQLKALISPPNDPLTLEELRQMDGEPVWIEGNPPLIGQWAIMYGGSEFFIQFNAGCNAMIAEEYGKTWLAYRRKPEDANE